MTWFWLALISPFLYALTNHIDKFLLEKFFKVSGVGVLVLFSSLLSILALPVIYLGDPTVMSVDKTSILVLALVGLLHLGVLWFYLLALKDDEASIIIIFYQLVPVFGYVLGYFLLGEVLTKMQLISMAIIILGMSIVSFEMGDNNNLKLRRNTILYMLIASLFWALGGVIFKYVAIEENVWRSLFWEHVVLVAAGILIFVFVPTYRKHFLTALRENSKAIISLNVLNEALYMAGNLLISFVYLMAPIALVLLAEAFQPIFVLGIGLLLTVFFPKISVENIQAKHLWQKSVAIALTGLGTYLLLTS